MIMYIYPDPSHSSPVSSLLLFFIILTHFPHAVKSKMLRVTFQCFPSPVRMTSMLVLSACVCLVAWVPLSAAYSTGPPVSVSGVCTDMDPTGHGAVAQTAASPFEVVTNQACYKDGQTVQGKR